MPTGSRSWAAPPPNCCASRRSRPTPQADAFPLVLPGGLQTGRCARLPAACGTRPGRAAPPAACAIPRAPAGPMSASEAARTAIGSRTLPAWARPAGLGAAFRRQFLLGLVAQAAPAAVPAARGRVPLLLRRRASAIDLLGHDVGILFGRRCPGCGAPGCQTDCTNFAPLLPQDALDAADRVTLAVEEMADAAQEIDVFRTIVAPRRRRASSA